MVNERTTLDELQRFIREREIGILGEHLVDLSFVYSAASMGDISQREAIEDLKKYRIFVEFWGFGSSIENNIISGDGFNLKPDNFTLNFIVEGSDMEQRPMQFYRDCKPRELEIEMGKDVEVLKAMGFNIAYNGYNPVRNCVF
ncbi:hypothetical protein GOV12_07125 [Candidatus Pacearchaeota archaeon]|nr:hypothetical protein [Candidatus Pacearchaeota archaeon]